MSSGEALRIDPVTVTVSALSCGVFFMLVVLLLLLLYRRVPFCCRTGSSRQHTNAPPHYHSRDALIGCVLHDDGIVNRDIMVHYQTPGGPFVIGKPSDYHLPGPLPRLPSYESPPPPPPSYEDSLRQPLEVPSLGSLRRLDDEAFPAQDQDDGQPGPSRLTSPRGVV
ncbi:hypothetical protein CRUP_020779 [Coryphaenoides rupestris]|nr:hypothetical protein CRUP_020779 [Coryphaenoides rupestris]